MPEFGDGKADGAAGSCDRREPLRPALWLACYRGHFRRQPQRQAGVPVRRGTRHQGGRTAFCPKRSPRVRSRSWRSVCRRVAGPGRLVEVPNVRRAFALAAARFYPAQPAIIAAVTGTSGKTSVAAFTRQIWSALGHCSASIGTVGVVSADGCGVRRADDARSGGIAPHRRRPLQRGRDASRGGGLLPWPRPAPARRVAGRHRELHQYQPRSSRLPRHPEAYLAAKLLLFELLSPRMEPR